MRQLQFADEWGNPNRPTRTTHRLRINGNRLSWFDVTTCTQTRQWTLPLNAYAGTTEATSWDGRYTALSNGTEGGSGHLVVIVEMDPLPGRVGPAQDVFAGCGSACTSIDWVGVSAGKYVWGVTAEISSESSISIPTLRSPLM